MGDPAGHSERVPSEIAVAGRSQLALRQEELDAIAEQVRAGQPIDERYRTALFHSTREAELTYSGKSTAGAILAQTMAVPLQVHKRFGDPDAEWADQLVLGDNLQVLRTLLDLKTKGALRNADGSLGVRCCYIDPPFATKREFRGRRGAFAYRDKVEGAEFVEYLRKRLVIMHELLAEDGALYLHLDTNKVHYLKVVLDEIFTGPNHLIAEIVWKRTSGHGDAQRWAPVHETILAYAKTRRCTSGTSPGIRTTPRTSTPSTSTTTVTVAAATSSTISLAPIRVRT